MRGKHLLDLRRGDVLATADDHLLDPSFEVEVPITQYAAVAGAEPVTEERLGGGGRVAHVSRHPPRPADHDLAAAAGRQRRPPLIPHANHGASRPPDPRRGPARRWQGV